MTASGPTLWRLLTVPPTRRFLEWVTRRHAVVFMLHRFRDRERGVEGHDPDAVGRLLAALRRDRYAFLELDEMVEELVRPPARGGRGLQRAVAFTMDDGYEDQARMGGDVFGAYRCPVTTFAVTGFLDGFDWLWWDKIQYIVERSRIDPSRTSIGAVGAAAVADPAPEASQGLEGIARRLSAQAQGLGPEERARAIRELAGLTGVEVPASPPPRFAPMTWDQARALERRWMRLAPHSVTHPAMDMVTEKRSRREVEGSWARIREELFRPVPVFAYPNGRFTAKDERIVRDAGLLGAVADRNGTNHPRRHVRDPQARYRIHRVGFPDDPARSLLYASGLANLHDLIRNGGPLNELA